MSETKANAERRRELARINRDETLINLIDNFQSGNQRSMKLSKLKEADFPAIISSLRVRPDYKTTIVIGSKFIPLTPQTLLQLSDFVGTAVENTNSWGELIVDLYSADTIKITQAKQYRLARRRVGGAFFPSLNTTKIILDRYGIYSKVDKENYKVNCLILAIGNSGLVDDANLQMIKNIVVDRKIPINHLKKVSEVLGVKFTLKTDTDRRRKFGDDSLEAVIHLGLIDEHYFLIEKTRYTSYSIKNYQTLKGIRNFGNFIAEGRRSETRFMDSFDLIKLMKEQGLFKPMDLSTANILDTQYYSNVQQSISTLEYGENCTRSIKKETNNIEFSGIYYADFETTTDGEVHVPYMCCLAFNSIAEDDLGGLQSNRTKVGEITKTFMSVDCGRKLLEYLPTDSLTYFHNLGYDFSFIIQHLRIEKIIKTGSQIKMVRGTYKKKKLTFRDSLAMIASPLKQFTKIFKLDVKKEIMPYELYTNETVSRTTVPLDSALAFIKDSDKDEFLALAKPFITGSRFYHIKYAELYCKQDCIVLMKGFSTFREWMQEAFELDVLNFISLPSLAYRYFINSGCLDEVKEVSGTPRIFIQKCVKGGRCMTRDNIKYHVREIINDFDAVSLYPSAMARMGFLKGDPKIITELNMEFLNSVDGYFVEISDIQVNNNLHFPLQSQLVNGIRNYTNTHGANLYIDKIALEDFIKYQGATFNIVRGYYYDSGRNNKVQDVIKHCFNERLVKKKAGNPIEVVYKLLMNASYGKMIQKEIKSEIRFANDFAEHERYFNRNHNYIKEAVKISEDKYLYKIQKGVSRHFNMAHVGTEILSMSKRIMNEVMCLGEDLKIYYQDTDSMHIRDSDIKILSDRFYNTYGRELIGTGMGQFHNDFSGGNHATESIFLGKKAYIDKLDTGKFHIRMKGVPSKCIERKGDVMDIYTRLYNGETLSFDLADGFTIFKRNKDFSYSINQSFVRKVKF